MFAIENSMSERKPFSPPRKPVFWISSETTALNKSNRQDKVG
jgi:hypothetical protein